MQRKRAVSTQAQVRPVPGLKRQPLQSARFFRLCPHGIDLTFTAPQSLALGLYVW